MATSARTPSRSAARPATGLTGKSSAKSGTPAGSRKPAAKPASATTTAAAPRERELPPNPPTAPSKELHVFPNPAPHRDYLIQFVVPEFTCNCPLTGQPDFAHFSIDIVADQLCVELKSLKMYFWSYRNEGAFHEKVTNTILDDIVRTIQPRFARITAKWFVRGGITTHVVTEHRKARWTPQPRVDLPPVLDSTTVLR